MSARRLFSCAALLALAWAPSVWATGPSAEFSVKKLHLLGASRGTLIFGDQGVEYKTTDKKDARRWSYEQIKQVQVLSSTRVVIRTYEDQGWTRAWADRTFEFEIEKGRVTQDVAAFLLERIPRPVVTAVLPPLLGEPRYRVLAKHVRTRRGTDGELLLFSNALVYQSPQADDSRYWRFGDLVSVLAPDRYRLELTTHEGGGGATRWFTFQLKADLPPGFFDSLWASVNPPAAWTGGTIREPVR